MHLILLDYRGTLTTLDDPVAFVRKLKEQRPEAKVVLCTGSTQYTIQRDHPGLIEAFDEMWTKGFGLVERLEDYDQKPDKIIVVDDDSMLRRATEGALTVEGYTVDALDETGLGSLIAGPAG
jgi:PleD family two-component response regulator